MLIWITSQGKGGMIDSCDKYGCTPLASDICFEAAGAATWLIEHGADVGALTNYGHPIFAKACYNMTTDFTAKYGGP